MNLVDIANFALAIVGDKPIRDLPPTEDTTLSRSVDALIRPIIKNLIAEHRWSFATREAALVEVSGETSSLGDYVYYKPAGCLRVWDMLPEGRYGTDWQIIGNRIISSVSEAIILYTLEDSVEGPFPIWFAMCAAKQLAVPLAMSRRKLEALHIFNARAREALEEALVTDLNERNRVGHKDSASSDSFITG